jgi:uncharacterized membrane protein
MTLIILYVATFLVFMGLDYLGLSYLIKPTFERDIGDLLLEDFRLAPAGLFYSFYIAVLIYFVSWPALTEERSLLWVLGHGALIGALGYGTYEFTSYAVMKDWSLTMVATDFAWGTSLTAVSALAGVWITRALS